VLAGALHALRPTFVPHFDGPTAAGGVDLELLQRAGSFVVTVRKSAATVSRPIPGPADCQSVVRTAALIADSALDDLPTSPSVPRIERLPTPAAEPQQPAQSFGGWELAAAIGGGGRQALLGPAATVGVDLQMSHGLFQAGVTGAVAPLQSQSVQPTNAGLGSYEATSTVAEASAGVGFGLPAGRLSLDGAGGCEVALLQASSQRLVEKRQETVPEAFAALRLQYVLDLPERFFLAGRIEERFAPVHATFVVEGAGSQVTTRTWTADGGLWVGRRFF
jgi:hypothetical protein